MSHGVVVVMQIEFTKKFFVLVKPVMALFSTVLLITCGGGDSATITIAGDPHESISSDTPIEEYPTFIRVIPRASSVHLAWENSSLDHSEVIYQIAIEWNATIPLSAARNLSVDQVLHLDGDNITYWNDKCPSLNNDDNSDIDEDGIGDACDMMNHPSLSVMPGNQRLTLRWKTKYFEQLMGDQIEQYGIVFIDPQGVREEISLPSAPDDDGYLSYVYIGDGLRNGARYDFIFSYVDDTGASGNWTGSVHIGADTDRDGMADFIDADDDNDGIPDEQEAGWSSMVNGYNYTTISAVDGRIVLPRYNMTDPAVKALYDNDEANFSVHGLPSNSSYRFIVRINTFFTSDNVSRQSIYEDIQDGRLDQEIEGHGTDRIIAYEEDIVTGANYDNDHLANHLDPDDDNDGIDDVDPRGAIWDECPFSRNPYFFSNTQTNDIDNDGCEDRTEDSLPAVTDLNAAGTPDNITLGWRLIDSDDQGTNYIAGIQGIRVQPIHIKSNSSLAAVMLASNERSVTFTAAQLPAPPGEAYEFIVTLLYNSGVNRTASVIAEIDDDDDDDGISDSEDRCETSKNADFISNVRMNDIDKDGCEDVREDGLPAVANLTATNNSNSVTLSWDLVDSDDQGAGYIAGIERLWLSYTNRDNVTGVRNLSIQAESDELVAEVLASPQGDEYEFTIWIRYRSAVITNSSVVGHIDPDDDNDGIIDSEDRCGTSKNADFISNVRMNDIDKDGCEDVGEDGLPAVANLTATNNSNSVTLSWDLVDSDDQGAGYIAGIERLWLSYTNRDNVTGVRNLSIQAESDELVTEVLASPQGDEYEFTIWIRYRSAVITNSSVVGYIDPDDDNDGIIDSEDNCRTSKNADFISNTRTNDIDKDGCEDRTEDSLPAVADLRAISNPNNITLGWRLIDRDSQGTNYIAGIRRIRVQPIHIKSNSSLVAVMLASNERGVTFTAAQLPAPPGEAYEFIVTLLYRSGVSRTASAIAEIDDDDDDDGISDSEDRCGTSKNADFISNVRMNDIDKDGCEDVGEDGLPAVANLTATNNSDSVTLSWDLVDSDDQGADYIAGIERLWLSYTNRDNVTGVRNLSIQAESDELATEVLASPQGDEYEFTIWIRYRSAVITNSSVVGYIDPDDDNDGIIDSEDRCGTSKNADFISNVRMNDIDKDGCEDVGEDGLPAVANLTATNNSNSVTLSWDLVDSDDQGAGYIAGIERLWLSYTNRDNVTGVRNLSIQAESDELVAEVLASPQGDEYEFTIWIRYRSAVITNSSVVGYIDPDDDNDGIIDSEDRCGTSKNADFISNVRMNDIDKDGCEDVGEDGLPAVANLTATNNSDSVTLSWDLVDSDDQGADYIAGIERLWLSYTNRDNVTGVRNLSIQAESDELATEVLASPQGDEYEFTIWIRYRSAVITNSSVVGYIDPDDDNDGIIDSEDRCGTSKNADFISNIRMNDIDKDGCEDQTEDNLPAVADLNAAGTPDNITLGWRLIDRDSQGTNYIAGIQGIRVQPIHIKSNVFLAAVMLASNERGVTFTAAQLPAPPGEAYEFIVTLLYNSGVNRTASVIAKIDDDDDDDGVLNGDEEPGCELLKDCDDDRVPDGRDNCPVVPNNRQLDSDRDGFGNACDIDNDGDGLIELWTAKMFNNIRYEPDGIGYRSGEGAPINVSGCGGKEGITMCNGYELIANISLGAYSSDWEPIGNGSCELSSRETLVYKKELSFNATFDGNGYAVSDLVINRPNGICIGLFSSLTADAIIHNLSLSRIAIKGDDYVGGLVGYGDGAEISASYIQDANVRGGIKVGGLVGGGQHVKVISSYARMVNISGGDYVGGLVGDGKSATIASSYVHADSVSGGDYVGGLVGDGENATVTSSYVQLESLRGNNSVGGLVGYSGEYGQQGVGIVSSFVQAVSINGENYVGGLVGGGRAVPTVVSSYVRVRYFSISGEGVGGLIGDDGLDALISNSFWYSTITIDGVHNLAQESSPEELRTLNSTEMEIALNDRTKWCDIDGNGIIETTEQTAVNRLWDFGSDRHYPAIRCTLGGEKVQREWFEVNGYAIIDHCPTIANIKLSDHDGDEFSNACDIDNDGDGLIELMTAEMLNNVRHELNGTGYKEDVNQAAITLGCGGQDGINDCNGYELVTNISLTNYVSGFGWVPLGRGCEINNRIWEADRINQAANVFNTIFDGNGWTISDLVINRGDEDCIGLFGSLGTAAIIRNVTVTSASIVGDSYVGGLAGYGRSAAIVSSHVQADRITGRGTRVGGLIGDGWNAQIISSYVHANRITGNMARVGGLLGSANHATIISSHVQADRIVGNGDLGIGIGGLVGSAGSIMIVSSYVRVGNITGEYYVGGLVGGEFDPMRDRGNTEIVSSYVRADSIIGRSYGIGGLVGHGRNIAILSSYVRVNEITTSITGNVSPNIGGLIGSTNGEMIRSSFWYSTTAIERRNSLGTALTDEGIRFLSAMDLEITSDDRTLWCDTDGSGMIEPIEQTEANRLWDFGDNSDDPAITCTPGGVVIQRE